jgi:hypothetical protein
MNATAIIATVGIIYETELLALLLVMRSKRRPAAAVDWSRFPPPSEAQPAVIRGEVIASTFARAGEPSRVRPYVALMQWIEPGSHLPDADRRRAIQSQIVTSMLAANRQGRLALASS